MNKLRDKRILIIGIATVLIAAAIVGYIIISHGTYRIKKLSDQMRTYSYGTADSVEGFPEKYWYDPFGGAEYWQFAMDESEQKHVEAIIAANPDVWHDITDEFHSDAVYQLSLDMEAYDHDDDDGHEIDFSDMSTFGSYMAYDMHSHKYADEDDDVFGIGNCALFIYDAANGRYYCIDRRPK